MKETLVRHAELSFKSGFSSYSGDEGEMLPKGTMALSFFIAENDMTSQYIEGF